MPTSAERAGDFSGITSTIYDPLSNAPFANNVIPQSRISQIAQGLLPYFPNPTTTGIENYRILNSTPNNNTTPTLTGTAGTASLDLPTITVKIYAGSSASVDPVPIVKPETRP